MQMQKMQQTKNIGTNLEINAKYRKGIHANKKKLNAQNVNITHT